MRILVTGSAGHLGEGLMRVLQSQARKAVGMDLLQSKFTHHVASFNDRTAVEDIIEGIDVVVHAGSLHKPHIATHSSRDFVETNVLGTLNLLEAAVAARVSAFVFTSTTSAFGAALSPAFGESTAWITEKVRPIPKNIYGVTKIAAENLCELFHRQHGLPCLVLRTSRFFPEEDDNRHMRDSYDSLNLKVNELLYRRVDLADAVDAHLLAIDNASRIGFGRYLISATTPFSRRELNRLSIDADTLVKRMFPDYPEVYAKRGWRMPRQITRVYDNKRARTALGWQPQFDFRRALAKVAANRYPFSELSRMVGSKGYHARRYSQGPYPVFGETHE